MTDTKSDNAKTYSEWLMDNRIELYLMGRSGDVYQVRIWLEDERKYLRRSTKTTDLDAARSRAREIYLNVYSDIASGKKIFGITLGDLVDKFIEYRREDVINGRITAGRLGTIESQCRALLRIKRPTLKVSELHKNSFYEWFNLRKKDNPSVTIVTVRNEQATINQMFRYAYRNGYSHIPKMEFRELKIGRGEIGRRDTFTAKEYTDLYTYMRTYTSKKACENADERIERQKIRNYILILANTCLRTGELRQMTWNDVQGFESVIDDAGNQETLVRLNVRAETSKVRWNRTITVRGGRYIERLKELTPHTKPNDLLFTNKNGTHQLGSRELYHHWGQLMLGIGINDYRERKLSYYSLRHYAITHKIAAGVDIAILADIAGTGITHIQNHYLHPNEGMHRRAAMKNILSERESAYRDSRHL
jgi:integrase